MFCRRVNPISESKSPRGPARSRLHAPLTHCRRLTRQGPTSRKLRHPGRASQRLRVPARHKVLQSPRCDFLCHRRFQRRPCRRLRRRAARNGLCRSRRPVCQFNRFQCLGLHCLSNRSCLVSGPQFRYRLRLHPAPRRELRRSCWLIRPHRRRVNPPINPAGLAPRFHRSSNWASVANPSFAERPVLNAARQWCL